MLTVFAAAVLILALAWGLHWLWRRGVDREINEGAAAEYARFQRQDPALVEGMDEAAFRRVYARVETPRFPAYALTAVTAFVLGTPLLLGVLGGLSFLFEPPDMGRAAMQLQMSDGTARLAGQVSTEELQYILQGWSGFYYFFGLLAFWIVILVVTMRRYHARTPGFLREEVLRSR